MVAPDLFLYKNIPWLVFSRVRPVHTNGMIFGFVGSALMGAMYYYVPRLVRAPLYSPLHRAGSPCGCGTWRWPREASPSFSGFSQSREYAEWIWPVDILVLLSLGGHVLQPLHDRAGEEGEDPLRLRLVRPRRHRSSSGGSTSSATPSGIPTRARSPGWPTASSPGSTVTG